MIEFICGLFVGSVITVVFWAALLVSEDEKGDKDE